jgi:hypothetical protein
MIELADPGDAKLQAKVRDFLESLRDDAKIQLNLVMDAAEAEERYGLAGPFDFVIESALPIAFAEEADGDVIWASEKTGYDLGAATHGGNPERDEVTTFFACGPSVKQTVVPNSRAMVDLAPTMARMLGFSMPDVDGKPIEEILR